METSSDSFDELDVHFLRKILVHSVLFGLTASCLPIIFELAAALLVDRDRTLQNLYQHLPFTLLVLVVFFLLGSLVGSVRFSLAHLSPVSAAQARRCDKSRLIDLLATIRRNNTSIQPMSISDSLNPCSAALSLFEAMGLIRRSGSIFVPVSPAAESLIASLAAHLKDGNPNFIGDWSAGTNEAEARRLIGLIRTIEEYRAGTSPLPNASVARTTRAGIALIRADFNGVPKFLVIKSFTWNHDGVWTPVMGAEEPEDNSLLSTIRREIQEEMKLHIEDIVDARELVTVHDKRISQRLGLLTDYTYAIFAVQLRQSSSAVIKFFVENPEISIDYSKAIRTHYFAWLPWADLVSSEHLVKEMPTVVSALQGISPGTIPQTVAL